MGNKCRIIIQLAIAAVFCLMLAANLPAADPIFKDDFICYDTLTTPFPDRNSWNDVAIDSAGRIFEVNVTSTLTSPWSSDKFYQYNLFDRFGNQTQPATTFAI